MVHTNSDSLIFKDLIYQIKKIGGSSLKMIEPLDVDESKKYYTAKARASFLPVRLTANGATKEEALEKLLKVFNDHKIRKEKRDAARIEREIQKAKDILKKHGEL